MYRVERVAPPRCLADIDDTVARDTYGEQAEWGFAIPWTYQVLAAPRSHRPILRAPEPDEDFSPGALAYWSALLHLLVYGFGWSRPDQGLRWWYDDEKPTDDPKLALLSEIWDADGQLDWFAAWLWTSGGRIYLRRPIGAPSDTPVDTDERWLADVEHRIRVSGAPAPFGGGYDPLHLGGHIDGPLQRPARGHGRVSLDRSGDRHATFVADSMTGWYRQLLDGIDISGDHAGRSWKVDVVVRPVGWLGTYRRSRSTGLWYSCRHRHHTVGN